MAPLPLEGGQPIVTPMMMPQNSFPGQVDGQINVGGGGVISLSALVESIIQRTYHDLIILSELLSRKPDMDRKISIVVWATKTRHLFIRLLALVKWAASASKVERCAQVVSFLDKQSMLFVETADSLHRMATETLVEARLPVFNIPIAVEVLTTGTYLRLPTCIRDRLIPPDPISKEERRATLERLNLIIEHRLVAEDVPKDLRDFKVERGRVVLRVPHEFEVTLTLMGDGPSTPWRLLEIKILVEDRELATGKSLVHPLQVNYLHQVVQSRLLENDKPLVELFNCLHSFCLSLQLEVLHSQTLRLCQERLCELIRVEEYITGKCLTVSYWREMCLKDPKNFGSNGFRLTIQNAEETLVILHTPSLSGDESSKTDRAIERDQLSLESLLIKSIHARSRNRLMDIKQDIISCLSSSGCPRSMVREVALSGSPATLSVPILEVDRYSLPTPCLLISVETYSGLIQAHIPQHPLCPLISDIAHALNVTKVDQSRLKTLLSDLRFWLSVRQIKSMLEPFPVSVHDRLPLLFHHDHPIGRIHSRRKAYVRFQKYPKSVLLIALNDLSPSAPSSEVRIALFHVLVQLCNVTQDPKEVNASLSTNPNEGFPTGSNYPKAYLKVVSITELQADCFAGGSRRRNLELERPLSDPSSRKRRTLLASTETDNNCFRIPVQLSKRARRSLLMSSSNLFPDGLREDEAYVTQLITAVDEQLAFSSLSYELSRREIHHTGATLEGNPVCGSIGLCLRILWLPKPHKLPEHDSYSYSHFMTRSLVGITFRLLSRTVRTWSVEVRLHNSPLREMFGGAVPKMDKQHVIVMSYDTTSIEQTFETVNAFLRDIEEMVMIHHAVLCLATNASHSSSQHSPPLRSMIQVQDYTYRTFHFAFGPSWMFSATLRWNGRDSTYRLDLGSTCAGANPFSQTVPQIEMEFNNGNSNLWSLIQILHSTCQPLNSLAKLPSHPVMGVTHSKPHTCTPLFLVLPQSPVVLHLVFVHRYCLEITLERNGTVSIADAALIHPAATIKTSTTFSHPHASPGGGQNLPPQPPQTVVTHQGYSRIPGLMRFLSKYSDCQGIGILDASPHPTDQSPSVKFHSPAAPLGPNSPAIGGGGGSGGQASSTPFPLSSPPNRSPLQHQPSPFPNPPTPHSPATTPGGAGTGAIPPSSPYPSPWGGAPTPGSPSIPRPSPGPARSHGSGTAGAASHRSSQPPRGNHSYPTRMILSHEMFDALCSSSSTSTSSTSSPLERFLSFIRLRDAIQDDRVPAILLPTSEPNIILFRVVERFQGRIWLDTHDVIHFKLQPEPNEPWSPDDIMYLERFFLIKVMSFPIKPAALEAYAHLLTAPPKILRDCIQVIKLELSPVAPGAKWSLQWCLTVPPSSPQILPYGTPAILIKNKILFFIQLNKYHESPLPQQQQGSHTITSLVLPVVHDIASNQTSVTERVQETRSNIFGYVNHCLTRFAEYGVQQGECSLFPSIRELVNNLAFPSGPGGGDGVPCLPPAQ